MLKKLSGYPGNSRDFMITSKQKVIFYLVAVIFAVFMIMNAVFARMYSENVKAIVLREFLNKSEQTSRYLELIAQKVKTTSETVLANQLVQEQAVEEPTGRPIDILKRIDLLNFLRSVPFTIEEVNSVDLYLNKSGLLLTSDQGPYSNLDPALNTWYHQLQENDRIRWMDNYGEKLEFLRERPTNQITMIRPLVSLISGDKVGLIGITLEKRVLMELLSSDSDSNNILLNQSGEIVVASLAEEYNFNDLTQDLQHIRQILQNGEHFCRIGGVDSVAVSRVSHPIWELISFASIGPSLTKISRLRNYVLLFLITNFIGLSGLILIVSKKMFAPVNKLIGFMKRVEEGDLNVVITDARKDEFGYIYRNFNRMVANIKSLFQALYEEKLLKKEAELKLLQSKINPHFIYNIFNNMSWLLELERYQDLQEMIEAVARYYKTSLNSGNDFIKISDNIVQLESYAKIQMIRFKNKFRCDFRIDPKALAQEVPIFILQPLLENAICHGLEPKKDDGITRLTIRARDDKLICAVEDNGVGIAKEKLREIRNRLNSEDTLTVNPCFALANINKRIKIHYGPEYGLAIISKKGYGTKVTLTLPMTSVTSKWEANMVG